MTSAILDNKKDLENDIARMFKETPPENIDHKKIENDRAVIQNKIRQLTKHCLTNFSNPTYLLKFAKDMKFRNETEIVLEVVSKCLLKIKEINQLRLSRKPLQLRLDKLEEMKGSNNNFNGKDEMKKIQSQLEKLPLWPHFAQIYTDNQYDQTIFETIELALQSVLEDKNNYEDQIEKQYYNDRPSVDYKKVAQDRDIKQQNIRKVLDYCAEYISDISALQSLIEYLSEQKEAKIMLEISNHLFEQASILADRRKERDTLKFKIEILSQEKTFLQSRKKNLTENAEVELSKLQKQYTEVEHQELRSNSQDIKILDTVTNLLIKAVFDKKSWVKTYLQKDLPELWRPYWVDYVKKIEFDVIQHIFRYIQNPILLLNIIKELHKLKEFDLALEVSQFCYKILGEVRETREKNSQKQKAYNELQQEETQLHKFMKYLPVEKREQLREHMLKDRLRYDFPPYLAKEFDPDSFALDLSDASLLIAIQSPAEVDQSESMEIEIPTEEPDQEMEGEGEPEATSTTEEDSEEDKKSKKKSKKSKSKKKNSKKREKPKSKAKDRKRDEKTLLTRTNFNSLTKNVKIEIIVTLAQEHILTVTNLITFAKRLKGNLLYVHLITTGKKCQERIFQKNKNYKSMKKLNKNLIDLII